MHNPYEKHLTEKVLSASPLELTLMLYAGAREAIAGARLALEQPLERAKYVSKAMGLVSELNNSLNLDQGGETAVRLRELYAFVLVKLQEGHTEQKEQPLLEAVQVLSTLEQAWKECGSTAESAAPSLTAYSETGSMERTSSYSLSF